jgi:AcrR family transcriptional regulator
MGIKERQERDREAVRRAILDAARELFVAEGFQNVSIRKIAERIEYSPAAIYGYFPSKDDIFFALAEEGFRLLGDPASVRHDPALKDATPIERVRAAFWRLYEFSREYERFAFAREGKQQILEELRACIDAGDLPASVDPMIAMRALMVGVLGVALLNLSERLLPGENADLLAADILNLTLAGLKSGVVLQSPRGTVDCPLDAAAPEVDARAS